MWNNLTKEQIIVSTFKIIKKMNKNQKLSITNPLFTGLDFTTIKAEYVVGYDASYDDDQYCYVLARKVNGVTEILLNKTCRIRNKTDKDQFEADVNKLAEYFNCEVCGI